MTPADFVEAGTTLQLVCVTIHPSPVFEWTDSNTGTIIFIDGIKFTTDPKYDNFNANETQDAISVISIIHIEVEDEGTYRCDVVGAVDGGSKDVTITVEGG